MKLTYIGKIRVLIVAIFIISIIQSATVLHIVGNIGQFDDVLLKIQNTLLVTLFIQFIIVMILVFYIPVYLHKAFAEVENLLLDINKGLYSIDIDLDNYRASMDKNFFGLVETIKTMLESIRNFDKLKKSKIIEHHHRINTILKLSDNGFIILDIKGNIVYINDNVIDTFSAFKEKTNLVETSFPPEIENNIKKYASNVLKSQTKQEPQQFFIPNLKRHIIVNSGVIRDTDGNATGAVLTLTNLQKKKQEKKQQDKQDESTNNKN